MKCQILFSGKNKKNNIILSSAENAQRVVKVKTLILNILIIKVTKCVCMVVNRNSNQKIYNKL